MARGNEAKQRLANRLAEALGEDWIGEIEKKYFVWSEEGGERVQIAISMTCPKNPVGEIPKPKVVSTDGFGLDFETMSAPTPEVNAATAIDYSEEEKDTINKLIAELGL